MNLSEGITAYKNAQYAQAFTLLEPWAHQGNAEAQCMLATMYHLGLGVDRDGPEAIKWYLKSSQQGYPVASNNLAGIYFMGDCGVSVDRQEAARWHKLSKAQGFLQDEQGRNH